MPFVGSGIAHVRDVTTQLDDFLTQMANLSEGIPSGGQLYSNNGVTVTATTPDSNNPGKLNLQIAEQLAAPSIPADLLSLGSFFQVHQGATLNVSLTANLSLEFDFQDQQGNFTQPASATITRSG